MKRLGVLLPVGLLFLAACSTADGGADPPPDLPSSPVSETALPTDSTAVTASSAAATSTGPSEPVSVDPGVYADVGATRYAFTLPSGTGVCWLGIGVDSGPHAASVPPSVHCQLPVASTAAVTDRLSGQSAPPVGAVIDGLGAWATVAGPIGDGSPPVLPVGSALTVSHMTCAAGTSPELRCTAQTGEFTFQHGELSVIRDEPSPHKASGAGLRCAEVPIAGDSLPLFITAGRLSCESALAVMTAYLALPLDGDYGNTNTREVEHWVCYSPTAASSQESGVAVACDADGQRIILPSD